MTRSRRYRHSPDVIRKLRDRMRQIKMLIERYGSYRARSGRIITRLGNPAGAEHLRGRGNGEAVAVIKSKADRFALTIAPVLAEIHETWTGDKPPTYRQLCDELALRDVAPYRGVSWSWKPTTVKRLVERIARLTERS
jgi:hypothetical protein